MLYCVHLSPIMDWVLVNGGYPSIHPSIHRILAGSIQSKIQTRICILCTISYLSTKMEVGGVDEGRHLWRRGVCLYMQLGDDDDL